MNEITTFFKSRQYTEIETADSDEWIGLEMIFQKEGKIIYVYVLDDLSYVRLKNKNKLAIENQIKSSILELTKQRELEKGNPACRYALVFPENEYYREVLIPFKTFIAENGCQTFWAMDDKIKEDAIN